MAFHTSVTLSPSTKQRRWRNGNAQNLSHYSALTFLPKFAFLQLCQMSTSYFLIIALLQQIPDFSPTGRWGTIITLCCLIALSMIREVLEDLRRRSSDLKINHRKVRAFHRKRGQFKEMCWQDLNPGDVIEIKGGDFVPADAIILSSSEPLGICYMDTALLDGESNLKLRHATIETMNLVESKGISGLEVTLEIGKPVKYLNVFHCVMRTSTRSVVMDLGQFLPRGARMVNTEWVLAVVVATGHDTKQLLNTLSKPQRKYSRFDQTVTRTIFILLVCLLLICLCLASIHTITLVFDSGHTSYLGPRDTSILVEFCASFVRHLILFHNIIPVSLLATVQLVRLVQSIFIKRDKIIYSDQFDKGASVQNSTLNEMLGQVRRIFTDKTGTLTKNKLTFRKCFIAGRVFESRSDFSRHLWDPADDRNTTLRRFFLAVSLCHTAIPVLDQDGDSVLIGSPDEKAVLKGARDLGVTYFDKRVENKIALIDWNGDGRWYETLHVLDYTSARRKMSVIVRCNVGFDIYLITKGADSAIFPLLKENTLSQDTLTHIEEFAAAGLRTMCYAIKKIDRVDYEAWNKTWESRIKTTEYPSHAMEADRMFADIEKDLDFLGVTAVEDELQDNVHECIRHFRESGIQVWMLSGDRRENAVSIAKSSGLLLEHTPLILLPDSDLDESRSTVLGHASKLTEMKLDNKCNSMALIVAGRTIGQCQDCPNLKEALSVLLRCSETVICFRVDPWQKGELVRMMRGCSASVTLAIGDGSNDVPMLQAAHIGIGISGVSSEHSQYHGSEAACVADYAIAEFSGLTRLIFVHGVWNSYRMGKMMRYFFYKNILFYMVQFWNTWTTRWSGQVLFQGLSISLYNVAFTFLPPLSLCLFDHKLQMDNAATYSDCFVVTQSEKHFNPRTISVWVLQAIFASAVVFFGLYFSVSETVICTNGETVDSAVFAQTAYTAVMVIVCLKAFLETYLHTWLSNVAIAISLVLWCLFCLVSNFVTPSMSFLGLSDLLGVSEHLVTTAPFWLTLVLIPTVSLLPEMVLHIWPSGVMKPSETTAYELSPQDDRDNVETLTTISNTLRSNRSKLQLSEMETGFAFNDTTSENIGESECVNAYCTRSLNRTKKKRLELVKSRSKSMV